MQDAITLRAHAKVAPFPRKRFEEFLKVCRVQTKDFGLQPFRMLGTQRYILDEIEKGLSEGKTVFVILKARQLGVSTFFLLLDLFWSFNYPGLSGAIATHTDQSREQFRAIVETFFAHLPDSHKIKKHAHNRLMLVLKNGSQFVYLVAGTKSKEAAGLGRSGAYNFCHLSEVAFWGTEGDISELEATMSQHYPHRLQVAETTAKGFNFFHDMWEESKESQVTGSIFVGWWRNELYAFSTEDSRFGVYMPEGLEAPLSALERKRVRMVRERYGFDISPEQIAWYRWQLESKQRGDQQSMDQNFPWVEEDAFVATGSKFFTGEGLTDAMRSAKKLSYMPFKYRLGEDWLDTQIIDATKQRGREDLRVWELSDPNGTYVIGCDPAFGSSETADRTSIHVSRCWADRLIQVAEYASPTTLTYQCAWILCHLAGYYRNCMVNLEISGPGATVFQEMLHLQRQAARAKSTEGQAEPNLRDIFGATAHYLYRRVDSMRGDLAYQWRTTHDNKHAMMSAYRDSFQLGRFILNSLPVLEEMRSMVYDEGSVFAEGRKKDDRVIAAALAHEAWKRWKQPKLLAQGYTYGIWLKEKEGQKANPTTQAVARHINFLQKLGPIRVQRFN
jgi:hypothetical protein